MAETEGKYERLHIFDAFDDDPRLETATQQASEQRMCIVIRIFPDVCLQMFLEVNVWWLRFLAVTFAASILLD
jgi:hypothetical protein